MNVALIGCGRISKKHVAAIEAHPDLELYATCDILESRRDLYNTGKSWTDYDGLLKSKNIDIVSICTPSDLHAEMAIAAANVGKHVLIEKPIALNVSDGKRVIKACEINNVKLCVVVQNRFNPAMQELKNMVDSGDFGKVLVASTVIRWYRPPEYFEGTWHGSYKRSGGVVLAQGSHHLDALIWLAGDVHSVAARMEHFKGTDVPDACVAAIRFESGVLGTLEFSSVTYPKNFESSVAIICERGSFKVGGHAMNRFDINYSPSDFNPGSTEDVYGPGHVAQYAEFVSAINEDREPTTDGLAALAVVQFAEKIWRSDTNKKWL